MKCKWCAIVFVLVTLFAPGDGVAQQGSGDVSLAVPDLSNLRWGHQTATFEATNNTDYLRFIVIQQRITLVGQSQTINRVLTSNRILWPGEKLAVDVDIDIPGVFGTGVIMLSLYDVVDTLDELFSGYDIFQKSVPLSFPIPDALAGLSQDRLAVPPRVDVGMDFGPDFPKLLVKLLAEGSTPSDIARIAECSESMVLETIDSMVSRKYLKQTPDGPQLAFPYISTEHGEKVLAKISPVVRQMADIITTNLAGHQPLIDSLVKAGALSKDSNDFVDAGTVIYRRYSMVVPMLLWYDLGQEFITNPTMLRVFPESDPCNAWSPRFMYLADQGQRFAGTQFYFLTVWPRRPMKIVFVDHTPELACPDEYWQLPEKQLHEQAHWNYMQVDRPENFLIDTAIVHLSLRHLRKGLPEIVNSLRAEANAMGVEVGGDRNPFGYRYWFWNLVATNLTNELVQRGVLVRPWNGALRFEVLE